MASFYRCDEREYKPLLVPIEIKEKVNVYVCVQRRAPVHCYSEWEKANKRKRNQKYTTISGSLALEFLLQCKKKRKHNRKIVHSSSELCVCVFYVDEGVCLTTVCLRMVLCVNVCVECIIKIHLIFSSILISHSF